MLVSLKQQKAQCPARIGSNSVSLDIRTAMSWHNLAAQHSAGINAMEAQRKSQGR
jgi:hypothetical protein